ncbi:MAG TPA: hypothetical protein PK718_03740 [Candidatus Methanofastidiosa archaeon]|nr:hypothetical protein [Candidatus Methanofastidiosa archaeon]HPR41644.1 hypothetical protein [Candidatus Methanofastidiosa archaeon]
MGLSEIIEDITDGDIENVYDTIRGNKSHEQGIAILEKTKAAMYTFRSQFLASNDDPSLHRTFVSLYKKLEDQVFVLERYIRLKKDNISFMPEGDAMKTMSNIHLLINSLKSFGRDFDGR